MRRTGGQDGARGSRTGCLRRALLSLILLFALAAPLGALNAPQAWAKDGGSSGGGSDGGSDGGGGDHDSGGHDSGGHGGSSSGHGGGDDSGGDHDRDRSDKGRSKDSGRDRDEVEVRYSDGWSESVKEGRYVLRDAGRRVVVNRAARQSDRARLRDLGR